MVAPFKRFWNVPDSIAEAELATPPMAIAARPAVAIHLSLLICPSGVWSPTPTRSTASCSASPSQVAARPPPTSLPVDSEHGPLSVLACQTEQRAARLFDDLVCHQDMLRAGMDIA